MESDRATSREEITSRADPTAAAAPISITPSRGIMTVDVVLPVAAHSRGSCDADLGPLFSQQPMAFVRARRISYSFLNLWAFK